MTVTIKLSQSTNQVMKSLKPLTPKQLEREIARRNRIFRKANAAQKRVLIAKDVLEQLKAGKIKATRGCFLRIRSLSGLLTNRDAAYKESLQATFLRGDIEQCEACADGALMLSCTLFNNKYSTGAPFYNLDVWINSKKSMKNKLNVIFSRSQLRLIENAFEKGDGAFQKFKKTPEAKKAIQFGRRFSTPKNRLKEIMKNIVKNRGAFVP